MEIIYCDTQHQRCATIAVECGMHYGAQLPSRKVYFDPYFTDQNWKKPDKEKYGAAVAHWKPTMASVLDWERNEQLPDVLEWAEMVAPHTANVILIPKVHGGIARLPKTIGGKRVILGYSVPTSYGGTSVPIDEFRGWPVHLLGGSPKAQIDCWRKFTAIGTDVVSVDGNMASKMAIRHRRYWNGSKWEDMPDQVLEAYNDPTLDNRFVYFQRSIENILTGWRDVLSRQSTRKEKRIMTNVIDQQFGGEWAAYHGDSCEVIHGIPDNSIGFSIYSPPFASLYTYSNSDRDMGNCRGPSEFFDHFQYLTKELFRVLQPGRLMSVHCMNLPTSKTHDGYIGIHDFRGDLIRIFQSAGFIYHSEVVIWKDPVTAMQRTKALGLLHKQIKKDSTMSRQGIPDYLVTMRKPGTNPDPVAGPLTYFVGENPPPESDDEDRKSIDIWQRYASPVWMDINPSKTLQYRSAREHNDEKHIAPLQLEVIERALQLWTNPGDTVLSPFMGIGSEGHEAIRLGRRFVGCELKESYYRQAVRNLHRAEQIKDSPTMFDLLDEYVEQEYEVEA